MIDLSTKKFFPVIHCVPLEDGGIGHALANTKVAMQNNADGVFLIGHRMVYDDLCYIYEHVRKQHPELWIGINFLDVSIHQQPNTMLDLVKKCEGLNALWTDMMPLDSTWKEQLDVSIFSGVAFKYIDSQQSGAALESACQNAKRFCDIATTSGDKTGSPPDVQKLEAIKKYLDGKIPLAVASGVSEENVKKLLPYVDIFLVASSICEASKSLGGHEYLIPGRVKALAWKIHQYY